MAATYALGAYVERRAGSSPALGTKGCIQQILTAFIWKKKNASCSFRHVSPQAYTL